jgi:hypothetical protein
MNLKELKEKIAIWLQELAGPQLQPVRVPVRNNPGPHRR